MGCLGMADNKNDDYAYEIEEPATEEERLLCGKNDPFCFAVEGDTKECVTKVLVDKKKPTDRYCFHKERLHMQDTEVMMSCHKRDDDVSPYECPDLSHFSGWNYGNDESSEIFGPKKWHQHWAGCDSSNNQSPVDLDTSSMEVVDKATVDPISIFGYDEEGLRKGKWRLENNGHSAEIENLAGDSTKGILYMTGGPLMKEGESKYDLLQFHFHWGPTSQEGSEHTVDGKGFPMEMHIVHVNDQLPTDDPESLTVLGFLFEVSEEDNPKLLPVTDFLNKIEKWDEEHEFGPESELPDLDGLVKDAITGGFYSYSGSLTTPPCSPRVRWIVFENTLKVSETQLSKFRKLHNRHRAELLNNHRPVQPLQGRKVKHYQ